MKKRNVIIVCLILLIFIGGVYKYTTRFTYELTTAEKLEEYDALWEFMEDNLGYYLDYIDENITNIAHLKTLYRYKVEESDDFDSYYEDLDEMMRHLDFVAHLGVMSPNNYFTNYNVHDDHPSAKKTMSGKMVKGLKTKERYTRMAGSDIETLKKQDISQLQSDMTIKKFKDKNTLYIKYSSFHIKSYEEKNKEMIVDAMNNHPYDTVILDIVGNPGGYVDVTIDIMGLLTSEDLNIGLYRVLEGEESSIFIKNYEEHEPLGVEQNLNWTVVKEEEDTFITKETVDIKSDKEIKYKPEKVYLICGRCASAADRLCDWCNQLDFVTLIGQPTGASGRGYSYFYTMKNSGLLVRAFMGYPCDKNGVPDDLLIKPDYYIDIDDISPYKILRKIEHIENE